MVTYFLVFGRVDVTQLEYERCTVKIYVPNHKLNAFAASNIGFYCIIGMVDTFWHCHHLLPSFCTCVPACVLFTCFQRNQTNSLPIEYGRRKKKET